MMNGLSCIFCSTEFKQNEAVIIHQDAKYGEGVVTIENKYDDELDDLIDATATMYYVKTYMYCPHCHNFYLTITDEAEGHYVNEKHYWIGNNKDDIYTIMKFTDALVDGNLDELKTYEIKMDDERALEIIGLKEEQEKAKLQFTYSTVPSDDGDELPF